MKLNLCLGLGMIALALDSCGGEAKQETTIQFEETQPAKEKNESGFKNRFTGDYHLEADSVILTISKTSIIKKMIWPFSLSKADIDSADGLSIRNGQLFGTLEDKNIGLPIKQVADSIYGYCTFTDTVFTIAPDQVLKYYKGNYFLNRKSDLGWEVKRLGFNVDGNLQIYHLEVDQDLEKLQQVTDVQVKRNIQADTSCNVDNISFQIDTTYLAKPQRKKFKTFLKNGGFGRGDIWVKIKHSK